jgi:integrase/recombinase XerD
MEIAELRLDSIDPERGTVLIRLGKGKKDRMIPIGDRAAAWVDKYISDARPLLLVPPDEGVLFLTQMGDPFTPNRLSKMVKDYVGAANLGKTGACHLFRHTMATVMLDGGADIRYIQEMLGHADLSTTQIYTRVSVRRLKEVHAKTHPGARLGGEHLEGDDRDEE